MRSCGRSAACVVLALLAVGALTADAATGSPATKPLATTTTAKAPSKPPTSKTGATPQPSIPRSGVAGGEAAAAAAGPLKVGCLLPISTKTADSPAVEAAMKLAIKEFNTSKLKRPVQLLPCQDSACDAVTAVYGMAKLVELGADVVIGDVCSDGSFAALRLANLKQIPLISPGSTSPALTIEGDYFFRTVPSDVYQGRVLADTILEDGYQRAAIVYGGEEAYGQGMYFNFVAQYTGSNGTLSYVNAFKEGADIGNITEAATFMKEANPDAILFATNNATYAGLLMKELRNQGVTAQFYTGDGLVGQPQLLKVAGASVLTGTRATDLSRGTPAFEAKFKQAYPNLTYTSPASHAYDALTAFFDAYVRAQGTKKGIPLLRALNATSIPGVGSTTVAFDTAGDAQLTDASYAILEYGRNGVATQVATAGA